MTKFKKKGVQCVVELGMDWTSEVFEDEMKCIIFGFR